VSTLDLFGQNFVLLAGPRGGAWRDAARGAAERLGIGLDVHLVGDGTGELADTDARFGAAYGISPDGAVLVRPDGFVAWRAAEAADVTADDLAGVLSRVLCREDA
jgi:putative polyketide hydroxylase